ncbi:Maf family protein [Ornithinicoccus halotolerans]|uniref:Maf family protein n=1 Tax=Ornithinicoccus halotolerans TaxID=1748220 RepID=UPI0012973C43|nr:nucleoside triphosphate pyrophosphatase [Ornithinicoccus halotolerans]
MTRLLLASASPARLATLRSAGVEPLVQVSGVDEDAALRRAEARHGPLDPVDVALTLARAKAERVAADLAGPDPREALDAARPIVLGCDSVLELDGEVHGKPTDAHQAITRWRRMRGRSGVLHTGHWLVDLRAPDDGGSGRQTGATSSTTVHFANLSEEEIEAYVDTGEPLRVAGAFTVDGLGGPYVTGIEGDYHTVVGVGLPVLRDLLAGLGVPWHTLRAPTTG